MEILKPEQVIPYLPYSLKVFFDGEKTNVAYMSTKNIACIIPNGIGEYERIKWNQAHKRVKLILRPLSDYFKTGLNVFSNEDMTYMKLIIEGQTFHYGSISYSTIIWLCKEHYDFQNLIPKGLAIDINTIK